MTTKNQAIVPFKGNNIQAIGDGQEVYVIGEIGINHNGSMDICKKLIDGAVFAGCNAVKFQKRTPELCVPKDQWNKPRDTPWGQMTYIEYKKRVEFGLDEYQEIDRQCKEKGIDWFVSCWDEQAVDEIEKLNPPLYKAASASLTDIPLLKKMKDTGKPLMISTGMSTQEEIDYAINELGSDNLMVAHSTSSYPCPVEELNLSMIQTLKEKFPNMPIGYSGHEVGLATTLTAVALGATFVERHITLDRAMWGTDHAASVEIMGLHHMIRDIRDISKSIGDGVKKVYESEVEPRRRLRRVANIPGAKSSDLQA